MGKGQELYNRAKEIIPGGTQLLSKRPEMFLPEYWPSYYSKAKGCEVWDMDGNHYYDMTMMGVGANVLGYAYDPVDDAAREAIANGGMCSLNAPEEVELAELLLELHPWAGKVRYAKAGGEAMAMATRIAVPAPRRISFWSAAITAGMTGIWPPTWLRAILWPAYTCRVWIPPVCPAIWPAAT